MRYKNKKYLFYALFFAIVVLITGSLYIMQTSSPMVISMVELGRVYAGTGYCCDYDGSYNHCGDAEADGCDTVSAPWPETGSKCYELGEYCKAAPRGDYDGECEWTVYNDNCCYVYNLFCSYYYDGECGQFHTDDYFWVCQCYLESVTEDINYSRTDCIGDICYI